MAQNIRAAPAQPMGLNLSPSMMKPAAAPKRTSVEMRIEAREAGICRTTLAISVKVKALERMPT